MQSAIFNWMENILCLPVVWPIAAAVDLWGEAECVYCGCHCTVTRVLDDHTTRCSIAAVNQLPLRDCKARSRSRLVKAALYGKSAQP